MGEKFNASKALQDKALVKIRENRGTLVLRWTLDGERYSFSPGLKDGEAHWKVAQKLSSQIELDILSGNFDPTLDKYKLKPVGKRPEKEEKPKFVYALDLYKAFLAASSPL